MPVRLDWLGTAPPAALVAALAARDVRVHHARAAGQAPCVLASTAARRTRAPAGRAWIWAYEGRLDDAAATAAVVDHTRARTTGERGGGVGLLWPGRPRTGPARAHTRAGPPAPGPTFLWER